MKTIFTLVALLGLSFAVSAHQPALTAPSDSVKTAFTLISKSANVENVEIRKLKKNKSSVYLVLGIKQMKSVNDNSTAYGINGVSRSEDQKKEHGPTINGVKIFKGSYEDMTAEKISNTQTGYTFKNVKYPLRVTINFAGESTAFELTEAGSWDVVVNLKK